MVLEKQVREGLEALAAFACRVLLAAGYASPCFAAQLVPLQAPLKRNCGQRHDLRDAGRFGSTPAETQAPEPLRQPGRPPPRTFKEGKGKKTRHSKGPRCVREGARTTPPESAGRLPPPTEEEVEGPKAAKATRSLFPNTGGREERRTG
jgi:hypothetical protein